MASHLAVSASLAAYISAAMPSLSVSSASLLAFSSTLEARVEVSKALIPVFLTKSAFA
jgi:hypothetical protein